MTKRRSLILIVAGVLVLLPILYVLSDTFRSASPRGNIGSDTVRVGSLEDARKLYDNKQYKECLQIIESSPDRQQFHFRILEANCEYALGNYTRALGMYESVGAATDVYSDPFLGQAKCHYMLGSFSRSIQNYEVVLKRDPTNVMAARGKGACLAYLGKDQESLAEYDRTKDEPFSADEVDLWLHLLVKAERLDEAVRYCQRNVVPQTDSFIRPARTISSSDKDHGRKQYAQMIKDRPQLGDENLANLTEEWCIDAFAGQLTGERIYWSADQVTIPRHACSVVFRDSEDRVHMGIHDAPTIRAILLQIVAEPSDHDVSEFLWSLVVSEQFNAMNMSTFVETTELARDGKIQQEEFCLRYAKAEHNTFLLVREFYVKIVWKGADAERTNPHFWHIARPTDFDAWYHQHKDGDIPWRTYRWIFDRL